MIVLLDVDTWSGRSRGGTTPSPADASAALLRAAGWRVQVVRQGAALAYAWQLLLAGAGPTSRTAVGR